MHLTKIIDLVAEVAAKRLQERESKQTASDAATMTLQLFHALPRFRRYLTLQRLSAAAAVAASY